MNNFMAAALPSPLQAYAPDFAGRFAVILKGLIDLIARRFRCNPRFAALVVPLCTRLAHAVRRAERLMALLAAGRLPRLHRSGPGGAHGKRILPTGRLWLIAALGHEAAAYVSQLEALFTEQAGIALCAEIPAARRLVLSVGRLVGPASVPPVSRSRVRRRSRRSGPLPRTPAPSGPGSTAPFANATDPLRLPASNLLRYQIN
jgi:hypothetical protein